jgi:thioredoxin 1
MKPKVIKEASFEAEVLNATQPAVVNFCAPWSKPCRILSQAFDEVAANCDCDARFFHVNVDDNPDLGGWYGIQSVPTLLFFSHGKIAAKIVGTASKEAILAKLKPLTAATGAALPAFSLAH